MSAPAPIADVRARQANREPGRIEDLGFMARIRTEPLAKLYPVPFQAAEWRWLAIDREVKRRAKPWTRLLLKLAPNMRANVQPASYPIAPPVKVLGAERVPCRECGRAIRATGKGPVSRRGDGWRCWRCCK